MKQAKRSTGRDHALPTSNSVRPCRCVAMEQQRAPIRTSFLVRYFQINNCTERVLRGPGIGRNERLGRSTVVAVYGWQGNGNKGEIQQSYCTVQYLNTYR